MTWSARIRTLLRSVFRRSDLERDMHDELRFHIESYADDLVRGGLSRDEAMRRARIEFGTIDAKKDECRASLGLRLWDELRSDLRYALRVLRKSPGFTTIAVLTLALGIGANTAMFSVVDAVIFRPLPFTQPDRLVHVAFLNTAHAGTPVTTTESYADFLDWRAHQRAFTGIATDIQASFTVTGVDQPRHVDGEVVSFEFFPVLRVEPALGRSFEPGDEAASKGAVILSHALWQEMFHGDPSVLGRQIVLDARSYRIVGVMPRGFVLPMASEQPQIWVSLAAHAQYPMFTQRGAHVLTGALARLRPGVGIEQAQAAMSALAQSLTRQYPDTNADRGAIRVIPELTYVVGDQRPMLLLLLGAVGCVLLIACANVVSLLLARAVGRRREMAVRVALGASHARLARQLITEAVVLAGFGALLGSGIAYAVLRLVLPFLPSNLPRLLSIAIDARVLAFTVAVALVAGLSVAAIPAIQASAGRFADVLAHGFRSTETSRQRRVRAVLVVVQTAVGMVLLVSAGLLLKSFAGLLRANPGFDPHSVVIANFELPYQRYSYRQQVDFYSRLMGQLRNLPGITAATGALPLPLTWSGIGTSVEIEGHPASADKSTPNMSVITADYLATLRIPLREGRNVGERDTLDGPAVALVNEAFVRRYFAGENPIGKRIRPSFSVTTPQPPWREIVGVVGDVKRDGLRREVKPEFYLPYQQALMAPLAIAVRSRLSTAAAGREIEEAVHAMDPQLAVYDVHGMEQNVELSLAETRFLALLLGGFAALALILTAIGLYGLLAYSVAQRTREFGIRMALGAQTGSVLANVLRDGVTIVMGGVGIGIVAALAATRLLTSELYGTKAADPLTFATVTSLLLIVALAACYVPARRAARVDPMVALRYE